MIRAFGKWRSVGDKVGWLGNGHNMIQQTLLQAIPRFLRGTKLELVAGTCYLDSAHVLANSEKKPTFRFPAAKFLTSTSKILPHASSSANVTPSKSIQGYDSLALPCLYHIPPCSPFDENPVLTCRLFAAVILHDLSFFQQLLEPPRNGTGKNDDEEEKEGDEDDDGCMSLACMTADGVLLLFLVMSAEARQRHCQRRARMATTARGSIPITPIIRHAALILTL